MAASLRRQVIDRFHMAKHFELTITDAALTWRRKDAAIMAEAALDGLYVIRTSLAAEQLDAGAAVAAYKSLANVERAFRSMKTVDLQVCPVFHYSEQRVRTCSCAGWPTTSSGTCANA